MRTAASRTPSERPLRVLYLSWRDRDNPEAGGAETFTDRTGEVMVARGHRVTLLTSSFPGAEPETEHGGVRVLRRGNRFTCYLHGLAHVARHRGDYDVIVDVQNGVPFWAPLAAKVPVVNVVHHVHRDQWRVVFGRVGGAIGWFVESRVAPVVYRRSRYVTVSQATRSDLATLGIPPERVDLVYSGNDHPPALESYAREPRSEQPSITVVGRLVPHKQVEIAIDVVADLQEQQPELTLDVVGAGYWLEELQAYAERRGVAGRVHFHGFVDEHTKHTLLARSWVLLMPSHKEGWGLTIVEAGLHATPAIAFAYAGGPTESIVHGRTGLLSRDADDMREQVARLLTDHELRHALGERARTHARSFDWTTAGEKLIHTLRSVLGQVERAPQPTVRLASLTPIDQLEVPSHEDEPTETDGDRDAQERSA